MKNNRQARHMEPGASLRSTNRKKTGPLISFLEQTISAFQLAADAIILENRRIGLNFDNLLDLALDALEPSDTLDKKLSTLLLSQPKLNDWFYIKLLTRTLK